MNSAAVRFNPWPYAIVAAFAVFIAGTIALIVVASAGRADLVARDYYEQEIRYQARVDQLRRTQPWEAQIAVTFDRATRQLLVSLPPNHATQARGRVELYRPSEAGLDRTLPLVLDAAGRQSLGATDLADGLWKARLVWQVGADEFFADRTFVIPGASKP